MGLAARRTLIGRRAVALISARSAPPDVSRSMQPPQCGAHHTLEDFTHRFGIARFGLKPRIFAAARRACIRTRSGAFGVALAAQPARAVDFPARRTGVVLQVCDRSSRAAAQAPVFPDRHRGLFRGGVIPSSARTLSGLEASSDLSLRSSSRASFCSRVASSATSISVAWGSRSDILPSAAIAH